jgi:hypothetical protein
MLSSGLNGVPFTMVSSMLPERLFLQAFRMHRVMQQQTNVEEAKFFGVVAAS